MSKLTESSLSITLQGGIAQEVPINLELYAEAAQLGVSVPQLINLRYPTDEGNGLAFAQMMASSGLYLSDDRNFGRRAPNIGFLFDRSAEVSGGSVIRPDGSQSRTPSGRLLFPAVLLDLLESALRDNREGYNGAFMSMVAFTRTITSPKYEQVIVNHSASQAARGQPIGQLSRPTRMLELTVSDTTKSIPTYSIGMEISKEAMAAATLDLVALALREHALEERSAIIDRDLVAMVNGDTDSGQTALSSITAASLDASIIAAGVISHKAWVKFLRTGWRTRTITNVICDVDTYLAVEQRTGRPIKEHESSTDERLNSVPHIMLPGIPGGVEFFPTETSILGANTLVGLDKSKAIRRVVYTAAEYNAIEEFIMRKSQAIRFDWAERMERAGYDAAFKKMTLTV